LSMAGAGMDTHLCPSSLHKAAGR